VKNVTHLLLKALPHNCIATTIGKNSRIVIWYFNQSVGHLIANQCFRNRPPNPILLYKKHCSRSSFSFADSEVQRRISIDGPTSNSELCGHSATLKQIQNVATNLNSRHYPIIVLLLQ
jgi:hypothetical protein